MSKTFAEYLDSKAKIQEPKVQVVADAVDMPKDREVKPPHFMGMTGKGKNYKQPQADGDKKNVAFGKSKGLGDMASDKEMCYDVTKKCKPAKIPTAESFVHNFPKTRAIVETNPELIEHLVREFKNNNMLSLLIAELATHKETFKHLAEIMSSKEYGQEFCNKLMRSVREDIAPPFDNNEEGEEEEDEENVENPEAPAMEPEAEQDGAEVMKKPAPAMEHLINAMKLI